MWFTIFMTPSSKFVMLVYNTNCMCLPEKNAAAKDLVSAIAPAIVPCIALAPTVQRVTHFCQIDFMYFQVGINDTTHFLTCSMAYNKVNNLQFQQFQLCTLVTLLVQI
jgi:hypothetical protein